MKPSPSTLVRMFQATAVVLSFLFILLFLAIAWRRMHYPFELDRMESGMLTSVWRLRQGMPMYPAPGMQWAAFLYAPLFFYVSAVVSHLTGVTYLATRLVSTLATLGSLGLIGTLVFLETGTVNGRTTRIAPALFAAGLFASLYPFAEAWYDVGRVDSLALFFFLAALLATRRTHPAMAAAFWLLAFLTKQTFLPLGLAIFVVEWRRPARMLTGMVSFAALAAGSVLWLNHTSDGWFTWYAFGTPGVIRWSTHLAVMYPFADLLAPWPAAAALIVAAALFTGIRWPGRQGSFLALVSLLVFAAIGYVRAHVGANINAVIPAYAWGSVLAGVALHRLLILAEPSPRLLAALWLLAALQLAAHLYRPAEIPTGNLLARQQFLKALRQMPGDVWVVDHSFDAILAGKPLHADMDALDAVLGRRDPTTLAQFQDLISHQRLAAVILDRDPAAYAPAGLFTTPPFSSNYPTVLPSPGFAASGERDQPTIMLLPSAGVAPR